MTGTVLMRTVQVLEHAVADPEATPASRLLFGAVGVFGLRGEPGLDGVAAATAPATYDPDTHTVGVDVGTGASQAAAGNHAHAGVYDPAGTAAAAVAAVTPASIGAIPSTEKATPSGVATLDSGGKIPTSQLPALAITTNWVVASQAAMLVLDAQEGDVAIRTDVSRSFILGTGPASTLGSWHELLTPTDSVLSVDGRTGTVTLGDLYAALVHGHAQSDITGLTTALAGKASTSHAAAHASGGSDPVTPASIGAVAAASTGPMTVGRSSGIEVLDRRHVYSDTVLSTGVLGLMYFTPLRDISVSSVAFCTSGQAAGATPTRIRAAVYSTSGQDITAELANTVNDTSLFASTYTAYTKALSATVNLVAGTQYALGLLVVSGSTMPKLAGGGIIVGALTPFVAGQIGGLTDLPSSFPRTPSAMGQTWWGRLS